MARETSGKGADPRLAKVLDVGRRGKAKHSPLYLWMMENFADLKAEFDLYGPRWEKRYKALGEVGLTDYDDKPPTLRGAQATWYRVVRDMEAKGGGKVADPIPRAARRSEAPKAKRATPAPGTDPMASLMAEINSRSGRKNDGEN